jgi:hypothetical protein
MLDKTFPSSDKNGVQISGPTSYIMTYTPPPCKRDNLDKVFFVQMFRKKNFYQVFDENFARVYVVYASVLSNNKVVSLIRDEVYSNTTVCINVRQLFVAYRWFSLAFRWKWRYTPTTNKLDKYSEK